jgi:hypothetical protein
MNTILFDYSRRVAEPGRFGLEENGVSDTAKHEATEIIGL